jgi:hypothetical protein
MGDINSAKQPCIIEECDIQSLMIRVITTLLVSGAIALCLLILAPPAQARSCHHRQGHEICLEQVQRSAKYHWRYRVKATVDGKSQPLTRYNCRDRTRTPLKGPHKDIPVNFADLGVGDLVCQLVNR